MKNPTAYFFVLKIFWGFLIETEEWQEREPQVRVLGYCDKDFVHSTRYAGTPAAYSVMVPPCTLITRHLFETVIQFPFTHTLYQSVLLVLHNFVTLVLDKKKKVYLLNPVQKAYLCINCEYIWWSGKGPVRCLSPSLLSPVDDWLCWPVEGLLEFWRGCNQTK